jgi:hemin uptake protein HemP
MNFENGADDAAQLEAEQVEARMAQEIAADEAEGVLEAEEEGEVEIEHDGQVYRVPAALKDSFLRNADYTQKTQGLAQERRALEARDAAARQHIREYATLIALNDHIQAYDGVDWDAFQQADANSAQREWRNLTLLKEKRAGVVEQFQQKEQARALEQQRDRARLIEEGHAVLARELPEWSPDMAGRIVNFGANKYGFSADEIAGIADPRMVRVLHDAMCGQHDGELRGKIQQIEAAQKVRPAAQLRPGASTTPKDPSKMTIAQYHAWRNG